MKKLIYLFIAFLGLTSFNSCRDSGEWEGNQQFDFTIERDNDFIEKSVG